MLQAERPNLPAASEYRHHHYHSGNMPQRDNPQDVGGVVLSSDETPLSEDIAKSQKPSAFWEYQTHAMASLLFSKGLDFTVAEFRKAIEQLPTLAFKQTSYYEKWAYVAAQLAIEHGYISNEELEAKLGRPAVLSNPK